MLDIHAKEVERLQGQIKNLSAKRMQSNSHELPPVSLRYGSKSSYTIRTKSYKDGCSRIDCSELNKVIEVDPNRRTIKVEPRVTMEQLVEATLPYGLTPPIVPEIKDITVGGAIMGVGAESGSHRFGCFHNVCEWIELITAEGRAIRASASENADLFYGIPGSYGSLAALTAAEIKLIPANDCVHLRYTSFSRPEDAVDALTERSRAVDAPDFIDGMIFAPNLAVMMEGRLASKSNIPANLPKFTAEKISSEHYWQHVCRLAKEHQDGQFEEVMDHYDYFFRYDPGAFWMGAYLFHLPLWARLTFQGMLKWVKPARKGFDESEIKRFHQVPHPNAAFRTLMRPFASCKNLCRILHQSEKWIQDRFIIQDFCIPETNTHIFLKEILAEPGIFPMWLCPIKGSRHQEIFSPHLLNGQAVGSEHFVNFGIYGIPAAATPVEQLTRQLEKRTSQLGGRKVLYSRSYYTPEEFWQIYSFSEYEALRKKTSAEGFWIPITDKVLSA